MGRALPCWIACFLITVLPLTLDLRGQSTDESSPPRILSNPLPGGGSPGAMVRDSLLQRAAVRHRQWRETYDQLTEPEAIATYQQQRRQQFIERIGGLPEPTPLAARITGRVDRPGYSVDKVLFQSQPNFYVTAALFLPDPQRFSASWPAVVVVCGHSAEGKLLDGYQRGTALAALNGLAAMIVDPVSQGERLQILDTAGQKLSPTTEHTLIGTGAILVGWNTARWMVHDGLRAIDYLQSRDDILGDRIGVMGNSGGGTQTCYLMAVDQRVQAAAPSCYLTTFERLLNSIGPQDAEQNIFGQLAAGIDHPDYLLMRAPKPTLIACATGDYFDIHGTWATYRDAKRLFTRLGSGRNVELVEVDAPHGWHPLLRQSSVQFMAQHLADRVAEVDDPEVQPLTAAEMLVTEAGQVLRIPGAVSAFDQIRAESQRLAQQRAAQKRSGAEFSAAVRRAAGIRPLDQMPAAEVIWAEPSVQSQFDRLPLAKTARLTALVLRTDDGIDLPGVLAVPQAEAAARPAATGPSCLLLAEGYGEQLGEGGEIDRRVAAGETVLAIDLRGCGRDDSRGQALVQRAVWTQRRQRHDRLPAGPVAGRFAVRGLPASRCLAEAAPERPKVHLVASGQLTIAALHAAAARARDHRPGRTAARFDLLDRSGRYPAVIQSGTGPRAWGAAGLRPARPC